MTKETKLNHFELMKLPWNVFLGYFFAIRDKYQTQKENNYFKGSQKLANVWHENKDSWRRKKVS